MNNTDIKIIVPLYTIYPYISMYLISNTPIKTTTIPNPIIKHNKDPELENKRDNEWIIIDKIK